MINKIKTQAVNFVLTFMIPMFLVQLLPIILWLITCVFLNDNFFDEKYILTASIVAALMGILYSICIMRKTKTQEFSTQVPKIHIMIGIGIVLLAFLFVDQVLSVWILNNIADPGMAERTASLNAMDVQQNLLLYVLYALIIAPISEEFIFRIALYPYLKKSMNWMLAMLFTSIAFGAIHMTTTHLITATLFGMVLILILEKTKCIWITIICHIFYNMSVLFLDMGMIASLAENDLIVFLLTFGLVALLFGYIAKQETLKEMKEFSEIQE